MLKKRINTMLFKFIFSIITFLFILIIILNKTVVDLVYLGFIIVMVFNFVICIIRK